MFCSECLTLVTAITSINIMLFGLDWLCLSNSHALFLLVQHIRSLNIRIDFYIRTAHPLMLLTAYRAAELRLNMLKDNIEMDIIEMTFVCAV